MSRPINLVFLAGGAAAVVGVAWAGPAPSSPVSSGALVSRAYACGERTVVASFDGERAWLAFDDRKILLRRSAESAELRAQADGWRELWDPAQEFVVGRHADGTFVDTVDLYSPSAGSKRVVWERNWDTTASRTVMIYVLGTPGRPRVDIDAFLTAE